VDPAGVIWIGGLPHEARSFVARSVADRHKLRLYSLPVPELPPTVGDLARASVRRFRGLLHELRELSEERLVVEGIELFPTSIAAVLRSPEQALFVLPAAGENGLDRLHADLALSFERDARDLRLRVLRADRPLPDLAALAADLL
jgi:hypothetical protein